MGGRCGVEQHFQQRLWNELFHVTAFRHMGGMMMIGCDMIPTIVSAHVRIYSAVI